MTGRNWTVLVCFTVTMLGCSNQAGTSAETAETRPFPLPQSEGTHTGAGVTYQAPPDWTRVEPGSPMRQDRYLLARVEGDPEDAELIVFHFPGQGGSVEANVSRWIGQFTQADGSSAADSAETRTKEVDGQTVTVVEVAGNYTASMGPMAPPGPPKPNFRLLAAIIETTSGPWFFKLTGPDQTVLKWKQSFDEFTDTFKVR